MVLMSAVYYYMAKKNSNDYMNLVLLKDVQEYKKSIILHSKNNEEMLQSQVALITAKLFDGLDTSNRYAYTEDEKLILVSG